jgi:GT2 family glycosyltransferase
MVDISICIVNWNVSALLRDCLNSIYQNTKDLTFEVIVVDNDSKDDSVAMVKSEFPQVELIENKTNAGFTKANNQAINIAKGKLIMLLNPDTELIGNTMRQMMDFMDNHPECGVLGPKLLNTDGTLQRSVKTFPTLEVMLYNVLFLDSLFPRSRVFGKHFMTWWDFDNIMEVDQPMGSALLIRRDVLDTVGLFDQNIYIWFDEVDLLYRINKAGWKIFFTPFAQIKHHLSKSFKQWKSFKQIMNGTIIYRKSRNYFFRKHYGRITVLALIMMDVFQILLILAVLAGILFAAYKVLAAIAGALLWRK